MGSAASLLQQQQLSPALAMRRIDNVYQISKQHSDADLLAALLGCIAELLAPPDNPSPATATVAVNIADAEGIGASAMIASADHEAEAVQAARAERQIEFFTACGKFTKGNGSKGNLVAAEALLALALRGKESVSAYLDAVDEDGWTPLHHAAGEGHTSTVELLISHKAALDAQDPFGCTPLWVAAYNDRRDAVKVLLIAGANERITASPEGEPTTTPALAARRNRHPGLGDLLDSETAIRARDQGRLDKQRRGQMDIEEFNSSLRLFMDPANAGATADG